MTKNSGVSQTHIGGSTPDRSNNVSLIIHNSDHAKMALSVAEELNVPVILESAPGAAYYLGAKAFKHILADARLKFPRAHFNGVLDCGNCPGFVLNALRNGIEAIRIDTRADVLARLNDIASSFGAKIITGKTDAYDLARVDDPRQACYQWLKPARNDN